MTKEEALRRVQDMHPRKKAGNWYTEPNGPDWRVTYRYNGRRRETLELYVTPEGRVETLDGVVLATLPSGSAGAS